MATVTKPIALDESFNTTEVTPRNIADVLAEELSRITGRNASQVEYDNTESGLTADNVQDALDEIAESVPTLPSVDIQTAVDEFSTYNGGLLSECKVTLEPVQDLHGYDSPWVGVAGKNKLPLTVADLKANNTSGTWVGNEYTLNGITIEVLTDDSGNVTGIKAKNGTASANVTILIYKNPPFIEGSSYILNGTPATGSDSTYRVQYSNNVNQAYADYGNGVTFTEWNHATYTERTVRLTFFSGYSIPSGGLIFYPMIRLATESDPTFEPYTNICPISGHTQVDVDVSDGDTTQEQVTVNLGGTYYSGTLDVVSGGKTETGDAIKINTSTAVSISKSALTDADIYLVYLPSTYKLSDKTILSHYVYVNEQNVNVVGKAWLGTSNTQLRIGFAPYGTTTLEEFKTWLDSADMDGFFELATPQSIQLSPTMVKALVGENHLSAPLDGQEITESKYKQMFTFDDVIAYIQSLS